VSESLIDGFNRELATERERVANLRALVAAEQARFAAECEAHRATAERSERRRAALFEAMPFVQKAIWCASCALESTITPCPIHREMHPGNALFDRLLAILNEEP
jgi:hypothetical protein